MLNIFFICIICYTTLFYWCFKYQLGRIYSSTSQPDATRTPSARLMATPPASSARPCGGRNTSAAACSCSPCCGDVLKPGPTTLYLYTYIHTYIHTHTCVYYTYNYTHIYIYIHVFPHCSSWAPYPRFWNHGYSHKSRLGTIAPHVMVIHEINIGRAAAFMDIKQKDYG